MRAPEDLSLEDWQIGLRQQFGREQAFVCENLGNEPVFSEFRVSNPASGGRYRVSIRGVAPGSKSPANCSSVNRSKGLLALNDATT